MTSNAEAPLNAMTVDVEDWFQVSAFASTISRSQWQSMELRVERNTDRILEIFDDHSVKATFFVLGWVAERCGSIVRKIGEAGHEVACHGYSHRLVYEQSPEEFLEETKRAKGTIEDQAQRSIRGYRAASYSIIRESLWALDILRDCGFVYDSSIFPVRHDRYGIPDALQWPHEIETPQGGRLVEFPLTTAKIAGIRLPVAGGGYFRIYPYWLTRFGLRKVNRLGRPCIFYLHPWEIDVEQPKVQASWLSRFRHYHNLEKSESRLGRLLEDFRFSRVDTVLEELNLLKRLQPASAPSA